MSKRKIETFTSKVIDLTQPKLQTIWNFKKREEMDKIIAKLFFGCGIPFNVIKSNHFKQMIFAIGHYCWTLQFWVFTSKL